LPKSQDVKSVSEIATTKDFLVVRQEGKREVRRSIKHYNLDAIIAMGYHGNSKRATAFRQWATSVLRDFALRGYLIEPTTKTRTTKKLFS